jgi:CheY-like chemotaxis protein
MPTLSPQSVSEELNRRSILVVDDDATMRAYVCHVLRKCGYQVHEAPDGLEALRYCLGPARRIDLVLSDVEMPKMSGWVLRERLKAACPAIKILMMSGNANDTAPPPDAAASLLVKPFSFTALRDSVAGLLSS